jgi:hypothetical protein
MLETGICFGEIHSYYDLNLVLAPFVPVPAQPKTNYIDLAGGDGSLDLSEVHGEVKFCDRDFTFTFTVHPADKMTFDEKVTQVSNALNGNKCKITLDRDEEYYWEGRCTVDSYLQDKRLKKIVVKAKVKPYKLKQNKTVSIFALTSTEQTVNIRNGRKTVVPLITCSADNTVVVFGSIEKVLSAGTHEILDFQLKHGDNIFKVSGSGTIKFEYQEGDL